MIHLPKLPLKRDSLIKREKKYNHHRGRAAIEPIIRHLKSDHRAAKNFLKVQIGDSMNFMMAAAGFNLRKLMVKLQKAKFWLFIEMVLLLYDDIFLIQRST